MNPISQVADEKSGKLDIYPKVIGNSSEVKIVGDPEGLRYLANLLNTIADFDQNTNSAPEGSREHTHLTPATHLGYFSSQVEICRADAKGTGELPDYMEE
jgi:hypothetical protein